MVKPTGRQGIENENDFHIPFQNLALRTFLWTSLSTGKCCWERQGLRHLWGVGADAQHCGARCEGPR